MYTVKKRADAKIVVAPNYAHMGIESVYATNVLARGFVNMEEEKKDAKNVEALVSANMGDRRTDAKTAALTSIVNTATLNIHVVSAEPLRTVSMVGGRTAADPVGQYHYVSTVEPDTVAKTAAELGCVSMEG